LPLKLQNQRWVFLSADYTSSTSKKQKSNHTAGHILEKDGDWVENVREFLFARGLLIWIPPSQAAKISNKPSKTPRQPKQVPRFETENSINDNGNASAASNSNSNSNTLQQLLLTLPRDRALSAAAAVVVCLSQGYEESKLCQRELHDAVSYHDRNGMCIIPMMAKGFQPQPGGWLEKELCLLLDNKNDDDDDAAMAMATATGGSSDSSNRVEGRHVASDVKGFGAWPHKHNCGSIEAVLYRMVGLGIDKRSSSSSLALKQVGGSDAGTTSGSISTSTSKRTANDINSHSFMASKMMVRVHRRPASAASSFSIAVDPEFEEASTTMRESSLEKGREASLQKESEQISCIMAWDLNNNHAPTDSTGGPSASSCSVGVGADSHPTAARETAVRETAERGETETTTPSGADDAGDEVDVEVGVRMDSGTGNHAQATQAPPPTSADTGGTGTAGIQQDGQRSCQVVASVASVASEVKSGPGMAMGMVFTKPGPHGLTTINTPVKVRRINEEN
jgi:hypothetical protein